MKTSNCKDRPKAKPKLKKNFAERAALCVEEYQSSTEEKEA